MRIAVVGATGMLGHHVAREARRSGHDVIALYRSPNLLESLQYLDCEPRQADLEDVNSLLRSFSGVDAVIHCAAYYPGNRFTAMVPLAMFDKKSTNPICTKTPV